MKEAVAKMKAELGDDAVILHTKKYKEGGLLGLGSREMVEITAAIEDEKPAPKKEPEIPQRPIMPPSVLSQYKTNGTAEGVAMAERELNPPPRTSNNSVMSSVESMNEENDSASTMNPNVNQASSLEAAMKPGNNQRVSKPYPPMPYDTEDTSPMPYELEISSRSDLNTPKAEAPVPSEEQVKETQFIKSQSMELDESDVENEPDEKVYTAEPSVNDDVADSNLNNSAASSVPLVQPYNDTNTAVESSTTQVNTNQFNQDNDSPVVNPQTIVSELPPQPSQQTTVVYPQPQQPQPQPQYQPSAQPVQTINQPIQNQNTPQQVQPQQMQPQSVPIANAQQAQSAQPQQMQPIQTQQIQSEQSVQQQNQVSNANLNRANSERVAEQAVNNQQQMDMNQSLTPAQLAQAQAMMMAQFNQMQMAQAMQQAMAQVQAQAQEQVRQAYLQAQQSQKQQSELKELNKSQSQNKSSDDDQESQVKIKKLENEIAQMKALLAQVMGKDSNRGSISLHEALRRQEVNEDILNSMAAQCEAGQTLADSQSREAKSTLMKFLNENINFSEGIKLNRHGVRIVALLGTTGVGKTTTLAKIAAKFVLEQGINAALITADTYRISAVEQLRTYSDILGLPLEIVYSPVELSKAISKHRNKDLILIDTAGRSQHNEYQMKELHDFLLANQRIEKHIVLSTTTKISDAKDILDKFSICEPDKVIFTKVDETASVGLILNLLFKQKLSLSYLTNGQSVPDDITPASAETLADLLLRKNI